MADIIEDFQRRYRHTPLVLLSSLAPGADQLAAEVAREHGVRLVVPLPFPPEVYAQSSGFAKRDAARVKLKKWIEDPEVESFVVPLPNGPGSDDSAAWTARMADQQDRRTGYANAGGYIVRHCHALIALWDGQPPKRLSGTAEMVVCKLRAKPPALYPYRQPLLLGGENGPVYVVHTPRAGATQSGVAGAVEVQVPNAEGPVGKADLAWRPTRWHRLKKRLSEALARGHRDRHSEDDGPSALPEEKARVNEERKRAEFRQFHETCRTIDDFNRDAEKHAPAIEQRLSRLPGSELGEGNARLELPLGLPRLMRLREAAAGLAQQLDRPFGRYQLALFVFLFLAALSFQLYADLFHVKGGHAVHHPWILGCFVGLVVIDALLVGHVWSSGLAQRRLDYRALAEALRVRVYWGMAGIGESVADSYLGQLRSEMAWARRALQVAAPPPDYWSDFLLRRPSEEKRARLGAVGDRWVKRQRDFYKRTCDKDRRLAARSRRWGFALAALGWGLAIWLLIKTLLGGARHPLVDAHHPGQLAVIISGALVLAGGLWVAYGERRSYEELAKQYDRMAALFARGAQELDEHLKCQDIAAAQEVVRVLGREAITEHAQWLILRRSRPFELLIH